MMLKFKIFIKSVLLFFYAPFFQKKCPVCNRKVYKFAPLPAFYLENAVKYGYPYKLEDAETLNYREYLCPYCSSADRERLYALFINKTIAEMKNYKLLDIAPAHSFRLFLKQKNNIEYRSADLFQKDVDDYGVDITHMDLYKDNSFDIFICSHVLEHVSDDRAGMSELKRVLKKDGFGILMVPIVMAIDKVEEDPALTDIGERWKRFGQDDHVRIYSKKGFIERVKETGFNIKELTVSDFGVKEFEKHGISKRSVLYIVSK